MKELEVLCRILESEKEVWKKVKPLNKEEILDAYFNFPEICLRVRQSVWGQYMAWKLTYKKNFFRNKVWSYAEEYETPVNENIFEILKSLGFKPTVRIEMIKYYCDNGIEIQKVKKLGLFLEVEGKNRKECWKAIKKTGIKVSKELGIGKPELMLNYEKN